MNQTMTDHKTTIKSSVPLTNKLKHEWFTTLSGFGMKKTAGIENAGHKKHV